MRKRPHCFHIKNKWTKLLIKSFIWSPSNDLNANLMEGQH